VPSHKMGIVRITVVSAALATVLLVVALRTEMNGVGRKTRRGSIVVQLQESGRQVIVSPISVSQTRKGDWIIGDASERKIFVFSSAGRLRKSIGGFGRLPGQFVTLDAAQRYGDSIAAFDASLGRLSVFDSRGKLARVTYLQQPTFGMRVVDDSLILLIGRPSVLGSNLRLTTRTGAILTEMTVPFSHVSREVLQYLYLYADAKSGVIAVATFGDDRLRMYDYAGRVIRELRLSRKGLYPLASLAASNDGSLLSRDSSWVFDGLPAVQGLVLNGNAEPNVLVATYDAVNGSDLYKGGELFYCHATKSGLLGPVKVVGRPLGTDLSGRIVLVSRVRAAEREAFQLETF
jgi:hypothetical protein